MSQGSSSRSNSSPVVGEHADSYLLTSLVAFAVTVIATRVFLQITGFPQIGNGVLHIAHALWGGLLLFIAALLPLVLANRWSRRAGALLGGIGAGLFIDEVGKFITQSNDYFFPPALSLIYAFALFFLFLYLLFRRRWAPNPRTALYHALDRLQDAIDGALDEVEAARLATQLSRAGQSSVEQGRFLAEAISEYLAQQRNYLPAAQPSAWKRFSGSLARAGKRIGRHRHRAVITLLTTLWVAFVGGYVVLLMGDGGGVDPRIVPWRAVLIAIQVVVGGLMVVSLYSWLRHREEPGLKLAISGYVLSLVALQTLYFYLSQFSALSFALIQLGALQVLLSYRRWYLDAPDPSAAAAPPDAVPSTGA